MSARALSLALLMLGLTGLPALSAEKTIGRQVQPWRPRPLSPLISERETRLSTAETSTPSTLRRTLTWDAWISRLLHGKPLVLFKPTWTGSWPHPENPWSLSLTPGIRGAFSTGFGAELTTEASWTLAGIRFEASTNLLWADAQGITSWRTGLRRHGFSLELRGWFDSDLRPGELATTAAYRQAF